MLASKNIEVNQYQFKNNEGFAGAMLLLFIVYGVFSQYLWLSIIGGISLYIIFTQLWRSFIPPALLYLFMYHWIQVFGAVVYADYLGEPFEVLYNSEGSEMLIAATLGQLSIMTIFLGKIFKPNFTPTLDTLKEGIDKLDTNKVITAYVIASVIFPSIIALTKSIDSVNQVIQAFTLVRKVFLIILILTLFLKKTAYKNLIIGILIFEFVLSFVSYFSSFKEIIFYVIVCFLTTQPSLRQKLIVNILPVAVVLVLFMTFWSSVKGGYRAYLNKGSNLQSVNVSTGDALNYLLDKSKEVDADTLKKGGEILINRVQYMEQYAIVYDRVPRFIPFQNGANLTSTITFLTLPRFLNPNKGKLDPSAKTSFYTGLAHKNAAEGTSISMGYFADFYVDFGVWGMLIPLLALTLLIGRTGNYIINNSKYNIIFRYALFIGIIVNLGTFESDIIYYIGTIRNYLVLMIVGNIFLFYHINRYITTKRIN